MKNIFLLIIICILPIFVFGQEVNKKIERHFKRAEQFIKSKDYEEAINEYEQVINLYPDYAEAYLRLAMTCEKLKNDEFYLRKSINTYKMYIKLVPAKEKEISDKIYQLEYTDNSENIENNQPKYKLKRVITSIGINALWSRIPDYSYRYYDNYYSYGTSEGYDDYKIKCSNGKGFSINTDLLFLTKKNLKKKTKIGFSMSLDMTLYFYKEYETYNYKHYDWDCKEYVQGTEYNNYSSIGFDIQYMLGISGISKIGNKAYITWGVNPAGIITGIPSLCGLAHSANFGIGLQVSKKCIINPNIRFSYCSVSILARPINFQAGINLKILGYKQIQ